MAALAAPIRALARDVSRFQSEWPLTGARLIGAEASRQAASATGGDGRLSGWPGVGSATVSISGGSGTASVSADGRLWRVLEEGTRPHEVRARNARAIRTPHGPRARARVGGMKPKLPWSRALLTADRQVVASADDAFNRLGG